MCIGRGHGDMIVVFYYCCFCLFSDEGNQLHYSGMDW